jgi:feruloyl esterase
VRRKLIAILLLWFAGVSAVSQGATCQSLAALSLPHVTITSASEVAKGGFTAPEDAGVNAAQAQAFSTLPAFCRVSAVSRPSGDSEIAIEVWIPLAATWNTRFQPVGNGLWGGAVNFAGLANMLRIGYATASNDTGHKGAGASFALGHPEKLADFGYRAFHDMTVVAKAAIETFYGSKPSLSLVDQCGGAGRGVLAEVARYPDSYDVVAAAGLDTESTRHALGQLWVWQAAHKTAASAIPADKLPLLHEAAVKACDAKDGIADGIIADPTHCKVDPAVLQCKGDETANCLTAPQVEAARTIYSPVTNPRTGRKLFGPLLPGGELAWGQQTGAEPFGYGTDLFRYLVMKDPSWHPRTRPVDFDRDAVLADSPENQVVDVIPNLNAFIDRGGKLLFVGGWADGAIAPASNTDFYEGVVRSAGRKAENAVRLFMVPDMGHCPAVANAQNGYFVDTGGILESWHRTGTPPNSVVAHRRVNGSEGREVLVCRYPQAAFYRGSGDPKSAGSYVCR